MLAVTGPDHIRGKCIYHMNAMKSRNLKINRKTSKKKVVRKRIIKIEEDLEKKDHSTAQENQNLHPPSARFVLVPSQPDLPR